MPLHVDPNHYDIPLSHLLIHQLWASFSQWSHIEWLHVDKYIDSLKQLYGERDILRSLQCLENAVFTNWCLVTLYPDLLFLQMSMNVVDGDLSPFLSAYLTQISAMSMPSTRCSITANRVTWDVPNGTPKSIVDVSTRGMGNIRTVCMISKSTCVVCGTGGVELFIMDIEWHKLVAEIHAHSEMVSCDTVSKEGVFIASCSYDNTVRLWSNETFEPLCEPLRGHTFSLDCVAISDDFKYVASGSRDNTVRIWDVQRWCSVGNALVGHSKPVWNVTFSRNGKYLVSGSWDHSVRVWQVASGKRVEKPLMGHSSWVFSVCVSTDSQRILSASGDQSVRLWDFNSQQ